MLPGMYANNGIAKTIENLLDELASVKSTTERRIEILSSLERCFGMAILGEGRDGPSKSQDLQTEWWLAQSCPRSCVALALISLLHRLHLKCTVLPDDTSLDPSAEMTACFTMLQGLCLKDSGSGKICSSRSTLELFLAIIDAPYWKTDETDETQASAHAIDLLICIIMASRSACALFDELGGEDVVRKLMVRHRYIAKKENGESTTTISDELQDGPVAIKCAEFLLLFASQRDDEANKTMDLLADRTSIFAPAENRGDGSESMSHVSTDKLSIRSKRQSTQRREEEDVIQRSRRARSASPIKANNDRRLRSPIHPKRSGESGRISEEGIPARIRRSVPSNRAASSITHSSAAPTPPFGSPMKSFPPPSVNRGKSPVRSARNTPFLQNAKLLPKSLAIDAFSTPSPTFPPSPGKSRGRSVEREALSKIPPPNGRTDSSQRKPFITLKSTAEDQETSYHVQPSSPLKALMGPSPAVRRAYARSVSPDKKSFSQS